MEVAQMKKIALTINIFQYDELHTHSMYCSMSIMEFKKILEKLKKSIAISSFYYRRGRCWENFQNKDFDSLLTVILHCSIKY